LSKGISWRQRSLLWSVLRWEGRYGRNDRPVAWRILNYGPTDAEMRGDYMSPRVQWNIQQATRRALRSLERRGLVELGSYSFKDYDQDGWHYQDPNDHVPGQSRYMTGVTLTAKGREIAEPRRSGYGG